MIHYSRQFIDKSDIKSVIKALNSDYLTTGPTLPKFEKKINQITKSKYAVGVNSATSALHISCLALGLKKGDILWTSPNSFIASANCGLYCDAKVNFVDIDNEDYNMNIKYLKEKLHKSKKEGTLPKVIVPVHFAGQSCDMENIKDLSKYYKFKILEDASHALGGTYKGKPVGCCKFSDITVFSFHPVKIITTMEGGMAVTNNKALYEKLLRLRNHGINRLTKYFRSKKKSPGHYEQIDLGFNYRMSDVQASLGISQAKKINIFSKKREKIRKIYNKELIKLPIKIPKVKKYSKSSNHLYVIRVNSKLLKRKLTRDKIIIKLKKLGIGVNIHYIPIHYHPYYKSLGFKKGDFKNSENYYKEAISLPIHPGMKDRDIKSVIYSLRKIF